MALVLLSNSILPALQHDTMAAYGDAETRKKAIERGATGMLTKPLDFVLLRHEIDTRLEQAG
jgi:DNA-binding NtrC family response regulator